MRDGQHAAAGLLLVGVHPFPQLDRIVAAGRVDGERLDLARLVGIVAEDHIAMQVVAAGIGGPFVADEGREASRLVVGLSRRDRLVPGIAIGPVAWRIIDVLREGALRERNNDLDRSLGAFAGLDEVVPLPAGRIGKHFRRYPRTDRGRNPYCRNDRRPRGNRADATASPAGRVDAVICSPRAKRYASRGPSRAPKAPASIENEVCRWVSPKNGRVGKSRSAYGE